MTIIDTPLGGIRGAEHNGSLAFRGIRFAEPPTGAARFRPPRPVAPWPDVYDATAFGPSAPQPNLSLPDAPLQLPVEPMDEDCLFLNVYAPAADDARRPVLFWIHGGGYVGGSGRAYDGSVFTRDHDVVVVTVNYRMGALGFLHLGHLEEGLESSVNNGILDQICALEWTRDNITAFGGDPDNVMIFGESAGGTSTAMLLGCPRAEGLFHKAVVHSPHADLLPVGEGHVDFANRCIERLGGDPATNGMDTLRDAGTDALLGLMMPDPERAPHPALGFRRADNVSFSPAIDGVLIPAPIAETVAARGVGNVPFLGGGCRHEGTLFVDAIVPPGISDEDAAGLLRAEGCDPERTLAVYGRFAPGADAHGRLACLLTDTMFRNSMVRILDAAADAGSRCWSWMCTWETDIGKLRATHAIELMFLWGWGHDPAMPDMGRFAGTGAPEDLGPAMREYWVNFARTGAPSAAGEPEWTPYDTTHRPVLVLDAERRMEDDLDDEVRELWFGA